jgi:hypothetical protein
VTATSPEDGAYSPLWSVSAYDNTAFATVMNLTSAAQAPSVGKNIALVNCPVVAH